MGAKFKSIYVVKHSGSGFWRGLCPSCPWTTQDIPYQTPDTAEEAVRQHEMGCDGKKSGG